MSFSDALKDIFSITSSCGLSPVYIHSLEHGILPAIVSRREDRNVNPHRIQEQDEDDVPMDIGISSFSSTVSSTNNVTSLDADKFVFRKLANSSFLKLANDQASRIADMVTKNDSCYDSNSAQIVLQLASLVSSIDLGILSQLPQSSLYAASEIKKRAAFFLTSFTPYEIISGLRSDRQGFSGMITLPLELSQGDDPVKTDASIFNTSFEDALIESLSMSSTSSNNNPFRDLQSFENPFLGRDDVISNKNVLPDAESVQKDQDVVLNMLRNITESIALWSTKALFFNLYRGVVLYPH